MGGLFGNKAAKKAAKAAERAAKAQLAQAERQFQELQAQSKLAQERFEAQNKEMMARQLAAETLQQNLMKITQDQADEIPEVVSAGTAEQEDKTLKKRRRKQQPLSTTLGIE